MSRDADAHEDDLALPPRQNHPFDAPGAAELASIVASYLRDDLMTRTEGADQWTLRVAANALTIASREIEQGERYRAKHRERLQDLGFESDRALSEAIRSGSMDARWNEVADAVRATVRDSLAVANPNYAE